MGFPFLFFNQSADASLPQLGVKFDSFNSFCLFNALSSPKLRENSTKLHFPDTNRKSISFHPALHGV
jgi:hypothetical protein